MPPPRPLILVIGCGSIGERHVRTFLATRRTGVVACDNRPAILQAMTVNYKVETVTGWESSLRNPAVTGVVIATPAPLHVEMARRCLDAGKHVLIEKPLAVDLAGTEQLMAAHARSGCFVGIGYVLHFVPALGAAREFLRSRKWGAVKHVAINTGQHFPFFRPAYREIYYRDRAQGGGAIQDALTHTANMVEWIVGPTSRVFCDAQHQVLEGVTVEDTVNASARNAGALVNYTLNQFQALNESRFDFHAEKGSVRVEMNTHRWGRMGLGESEWTWESLPLGERDQMYVAQANAFLDGCEGKANALCTLPEALQTLRFNLAALRSSDTALPVSL